MPFKLIYPALYACCEQIDVSVADVVAGGGVGLSFRRSFGSREVEEWNDLNISLASFHFSNQDDVVVWALTKNKKFSVRSCYEMILHPGVRGLGIMELSHAHMPLKIKIFAWMCVKGHVQVAADFAAKG